MFQINFIGSTPYITCSPALYHHRLGPQDEFLVLSSDGLYQYFSNEEVVSHVECFMKNFPDGDPAQLLVEELLRRAAKKAGRVLLLSATRFFIIFLYFAVFEVRTV
jgi:serine/threonine protein phosphatase PrpC